MEDFQKTQEDYLSTELYELANSYAKVYARFKKLHKKWDRQYSRLQVSNIDAFSFEKWIYQDLAYTTLEFGPLTGALPLINNSSPESSPFDINGLKWSPISTIGDQGESMGLKEYNQLLDHIAGAFGNILTYSSKDHASYRAYAIIRARAKLLAVNELLSGVDKVMVSLLNEELPDQLPPKAVNFVKDNKMPAPDDDDHIKRQQLPLLMAEDLADTLDLMDKEMATILTISIRTYHRLKQKGLLNPVASERLVMLKDLADYGLEVFEDQSNFNEWLRSPLHELSNKSPLSLLDTATGIARVKTILGQIDYGVFS